MEEVVLPGIRGRGRRACHFFLAPGLVDFAGDAWNLHPEATGVVFPAGQSSPRSQCIGTGQGC